MKKAMMEAQWQEMEIDILFANFPVYFARFYFVKISPIDMWPLIYRKREISVPGIACAGVLAHANAGLAR